MFWRASVENSGKLSSIMKAFLRRLLLVLVCLGSGALAHAQTETNRHVVLITIDGLRPEFYLQESFTKHCPNLMALRQAGCHALGARAVYPSMTYCGHASIATGVNPSKHGVTGNSRSDGPGAEGRGFWFAKDIQSPTIWDVAHQAGLVTATLSWPSTAESKTITWNVPEFWSSVMGRQDDLVMKHATPGLVDSPPPLDGPGWDGFVAQQSISIIRQHRPHLILIHYVETDKNQHKGGRDTADLPGALERIDGHIGRIRQAVKEAGMGPRTTFIVAGDHGFADIEQSIAPNKLLADAGFISVESGKVQSWKAYVRNTGGSGAVIVKDAADIPRVREVLADGTEKLYRIIEKPELEKLGGPSDAAFHLEAEPLHMISGSVTAKSLVFRSSVKGNHGFLPDKPEMLTGFIISGSGIQAGVVADRVDLVDIAPTIAELLGLKFPDTDGKPLKKLFR
jgi:predicted AlkP superfamily pyrophosphatase or phosphodiesterase